MNLVESCRDAPLAIDDSSAVSFRRAITNLVQNAIEQAGVLHLCKTFLSAL